MSAMPQPFPCCPPPCDAVPQNVPIPGPQGPAGTPAEPCVPCVDGISAFTTLSGNFVMPAELANSASTPVVQSISFVVGGIYFLIGIGWLQVISKADSTHMILKNLRDSPNNHYLANSAPGTIVGAGSLISPSGAQGPDGAAGSITGPAGGDLTGTYPNPTIGALKVTTGKIALLAVTDAQVAAANKDGLDGVASMRTLGTGDLQACAGDDPRLSDARIPTGAAGGSLSGTYPNPGLAVPALAQFASGNIALPTVDGTATAPVAHGLAGVPKWVRWVLVCTGGELNYAVGNEVNLQSAGCTAATDNTTRVPEIADATNLQVGAYLWATNPIRLADKVAGTNSAITPGNWRLKAYAAF